MTQIRISDLIAMHNSRFFNLKNILEDAGLNYSKIYRKIGEGRELDLNESDAITKVVEKIKALI